MVINRSNEKVIKGQKSIFLAGPVPRKKEIKSWRAGAIKTLEKLGFDGIVYIPEYEGLLLFLENGNPNIQSLWEREALTSATVIVFWVPRQLPDMPAFTTNIEFGYCIHSGKIIYGRPDDSVNNRYLDWLYKLEYNKEPINNLEQLLISSIKLCDELYKINYD